jgi:hypothetical protein
MKLNFEHDTAGNRAVADALERALTGKWNAYQSIDKLEETVDRYIRSYPTRVAIIRRVADRFVRNLRLGSTG